MMENRNDTKRRLVEATYQVIQEKGVEGVTAREVAKRVGVTPTVIYRHFENLYYLTVLASIICISDYLETLKTINDDEENPVEKNILGWKILTGMPLPIRRFMRRCSGGNIMTSLRWLCSTTIKFFPKLPFIITMRF